MRRTVSKQNLSLSCILFAMTNSLHIFISIFISTSIFFMLSPIFSKKFHTCSNILFPDQCTSVRILSPFSSPLCRSNEKGKERNVNDWNHSFFYYVPYLYARFRTAHSSHILQKNQTQGKCPRQLVKRSGSFCSQKNIC